MSSESPFTIPAEFQFPETLSNTESFNTESFKAVTVKDPEAWFKYFKDYHTKVTQFKNYYESVVLKAQCHGSGMWVLEVLLVLVLDEGSVALDQVLWCKRRS